MGRDAMGAANPCKVSVPSSILGRSTLFCLIRLVAFMFNKETHSNECQCGQQKYYRALVCAKCKSLNARISRREKTLDELLTHGPSRTKWTQVRRDANQFMVERDVPRKCYVCGFNIYVECCHIKPIVDFSMSTQLKEVNSLENLIYLCPNHHVMMDKGLIDLTQVV